jgi:hypothetical protein
MIARERPVEVDSARLAEIGLALRQITEYLAQELVQPQSHPPAWTDFQWRIAQAVASMQGISSLLHLRVRWKGPVQWQIFLRDQRAHIAGRHQKFDLVMQALDSAARRHGASLTGLKGTELLRRALYAPDERPMADIDLLVPEAQVDSATRVLEECGFQATFKTWREHLFERRTEVAARTASFGEHVDNPMKIELHTKIQERLPVSVVDITEFVAMSRTQPGLNGYPSCASLMLHLLLHAAGNIRSHALRLIQLEDIARFARNFSEADWRELESLGASRAGIWWALPPLSLTARYYPGTIPESVIERVGSKCPWWLRRSIEQRSLCDVSWSNLRVYAFPGIEWSRSPLEAGRLMLNRIWPDPEARTQMSWFAAHHPGASGIPWYGISQARRMLRWAVSKPPRVQALLPVQAALMQPYD